MEEDGDPRFPKRKKPSSSPISECVNPLGNDKGLVLVMKHKDVTKNLQNVSPFVIAESVNKIVTAPINSARKLRDGTFIFVTINTQQTQELLKLTNLLNGTPVVVSIHDSLNYSKGVIRSWLLSELDEEEITKSLFSQKVLKVKKLTKENVTHNKPPAYMLTFSTPELPDNLTIFYQKHQVAPYYPLPLRCRQCLQYGHSGPCRKPKICDHCAQPHEEMDEDCKRPMKCAACSSSDHSLRSPQCPRYKEECKAVRLAVSSKISVPVARKSLRTPANNSSRSYSQVLSNPKLTDEAEFPILRPSQIMPSLSQVSVNTVNSNNTQIATATEIQIIKPSQAHQQPIPQHENVAKSCTNCDNLLPMLQNISSQISNLVQLITTLFESFSPVLKGAISNQNENKDNTFKQKTNKKQKAKQSKIMLSKNKEAFTEDTIFDSPPTEIEINDHKS